MGSLRSTTETETETADLPTVRADLVVVGAGVVGLSFAWHAARAGRRVVVVERDERAVGASVRNFGHVCVTAQDGLALELARAAREHWLTLADEGVAVRRTGTVFVARSESEQGVLEEFAEARGSDEVRLLTSAETVRRLGLDVPGAVGGAHLPLDLRVDAPTAIPALTRAVEARGVVVRFGENVLAVEGDGVTTTRGRVDADEVVIAVGHDVDRLEPGIARGVDLERCVLRMLELDTPSRTVVDPALLTGTSLLRYGGFASLPGAAAVRTELRDASPRLLEAVVNLMATQRPDGRLVLGDTHAYGRVEDPFDDEDLDELLLAEARRLLGVDAVRVRRRWRGVYASSALTPFLVETTEAGALVVSVTTGIGMTTALGLAERVLTDRALVPA